LVLRGGGWRKLHNEELHNLYFSSSKIRMITSEKMRWAGNVARMGEKLNGYGIFVRKQKEKLPQGRPRRRWENNVQTNLREIGCGGMDWINLAQDRVQWRALVNTVTNLRIP
jgi:hypothetical protein